MPVVKKMPLITEEILTDLFLENKKNYMRWLYKQGCKNPEDQDEIINQAFLSVWINRELFKGDCALNSWMIENIRFRFLNKITNNNLHKRRIEGMKELNTVMSEAYTPKVPNDGLQKRLTNLTPRVKQVMNLVLQDYSHEEVAKELGISYDTAKANYLHGVKYLRKFKNEY